MMYPTRVRRITPIAFAVLLLGPSVARAAECPETSPEDPQERRKLAKDWFGIAESAENNGNSADATRAYACSYKMVAHPYTAYNLARVADRNGENELALKMYKAYLTLKPDAQEKEKVKAKIKALEDKIAAGGAAAGSLGEGIAAAAGGVGEAPTPPVGDGAAAAAATEGTTGEDAAATAEGTAPAENAEDAVDEQAESPPPPPPVARARRFSEPEPDLDDDSVSRLPEWIVGGVAVAALVGGLATNLAARGKMSACQASADKELFKTAENECNAARPMATTSYVLFGVAAAAAATDAVLLLVRRGNSSSSSDGDSRVNFMWLPGGGGLAARGRF